MKTANHLNFLQAFVYVMVACTAMSFSGCHDGPLYALKAVNPYFVMKEWREDQAYGVTDHERREQLAQLADSIDSLPPTRQQYWSKHLQQILENDQSAEMRRLAVLASGNLTSTDAISLVEKGLDDDSVKVRMEACRALGKIDSTDSSRLLASMVGKESNQDVRHSAISALAKHNSQVSIDSLKLALADRNPATRDLTVKALRGVTGKEIGNDPEAWIAALEKSTSESSTNAASPGEAKSAPTGNFFR